MNSIRVNPFFQGKPFGHILEDVVNRSFSDITGSEFAVTSPSVNISESNENFHLDVAAPGLEKSDFTISVEKDQLIISASKKAEDSTQDQKWTRKEFNFATFRRSFHLSQTADIDNIAATYTDGILHVVIPKKEEAKQKEPKEILIK